MENEMVEIKVDGYAPFMRGRKCCDCGATIPDNLEQVSGSVRALQYRGVADYSRPICVPCQRKAFEAALERLKKLREDKKAQREKDDENAAVED